jgi:hypothetical protein
LQVSRTSCLLAIWSPNSLRDLRTRPALSTMIANWQWPRTRLRSRKPNTASIAF